MVDSVSLLAAESVPGEELDEACRSELIGLEPVGEVLPADCNPGLGCAKGCNLEVEVADEGDDVGKNSVIRRCRFRNEVTFA